MPDYQAQLHETLGKIQSDTSWIREKQKCMLEKLDKNIIPRIDSLEASRDETNGSLRVLKWGIGIIGAVLTAILIGIVTATGEGGVTGTAILTGII